MPSKAVLSSLQPVPSQTKGATHRPCPIPRRSRLIIPAHDDNRIREAAACGAALGGARLRGMSLARNRIYRIPFRLSCDFRHNRFWQESMPRNPLMGEG